MGGDEKKSIQRIAGLGLKSRISTWNRINIDDIKHSVECESDIIHISVPTSDIQIKSKLRKERSWVIDTLKRCVCFALERGREVTVGLEDASRADFGFLLDVISEASFEGIKRVRYADTVGVCYRQKVCREISAIRSKIGVGVEFHAHNDLGMAVANSIAAFIAGADFIDCTIGGIGERAGNCNYVEFVSAVKGCLDEWGEVNIKDVAEMESSVMGIIYKR
jgi:homocitrate synthase NifV